MPTTERGCDTRRCPWAHGIALSSLGCHTSPWLGGRAPAPSPPTVPNFSSTICRRPRQAPTDLFGEVGRGPVHRHVALVELWLPRVPGRRAGPVAGISANIHLPFPAELRQLVLDEVLPGRTRAGRRDWWQVDRLVWTNPRGFHDVAGTRCSPLAAVPAGPPFWVGPRLADLLDRYACSTGPDQGVGRRADRPPAGRSHRGHEVATAPFRAVRSALASPPRTAARSPLSHRQGHADALARPAPRIALFGLTTMPPIWPAA
jgi:hypothetical protein